MQINYRCRRCHEQIAVPDPEIVAQVAALFTGEVTITVKHICPKCSAPHFTDYKAGDFDRQPEGIVLD